MERKIVKLIEFEKIFNLVSDIYKPDKIMVEEVLQFIHFTKGRDTTGYYLENSESPYGIHCALERVKHKVQQRLQGNLEMILRLARTAKKQDIEGYLSQIKDGLYLYRHFLDESSLASAEYLEKD